MLPPTVKLKISRPDSLNDNKNKFRNTHDMSVLLTSKCNKKFPQIAFSSLGVYMYTIRACINDIKFFHFDIFPRGYRERSDF